MRLIHAEYQGYNHSPGYCIRSGESFADKQKCWYNALTLAKSTNGGATFSHAAPPDHYVGGPPYRYLAGTGPIGFFQPSNIVRGKDGLYYVLVHVEDYGVQPYGTCLWRTATSPTRSPGGHGTAQPSPSGSATPTGTPTTRPRGSARRCPGTGSAPSRRA